MAIPFSAAESAFGRGWTAEDVRFGEAGRAGDRPQRADSSQLRDGLRSERYEIPLSRG